MSDSNCHGPDCAGGADTMDAAWEAEIESRVSGTESGTVTLLTRGQFMRVFDEAREEIRGRKANV